MADHRRVEGSNPAGDDVDRDLGELVVRIRDHRRLQRRAKWVACTIVLAGIALGITVAAVVPAQKAWTSDSYSHAEAGVEVRVTSYGERETQESTQARLWIAGAIAGAGLLAAAAAWRKLEPRNDPEDELD